MFSCLTLSQSYSIYSEYTAVYYYTIIIISRGYSSISIPKSSGNILQYIFAHLWTGVQNYGAEDGGGGRVLGKLPLNSFVFAKDHNHCKMVTTLMH